MTKVGIALASLIGIAGLIFGYLEWQAALRPPANPVLPSTSRGVPQADRSAGPGPSVSAKSALPRTLAGTPNADNMQAPVSARTNQPTQATPPADALPNPYRQFRADLLSDDPDRRNQAVNTALKTLDPAVRTTLLKMMFSSPDTAIRMRAASALMKMIGDREAMLPIEIPDDADTNALTDELRTLSVRVGGYNADVGKFDAGFMTGNNGHLTYGSVTSSGLSLNGTAEIGGQLTGLSMHLSPEANGRLVGTAYSNGLRSPVVIPLL